MDKPWKAPDFIETMGEHMSANKLKEMLEDLVRSAGVDEDNGDGDDCKNTASSKISDKLEAFMGELDIKNYVIAALHSDNKKVLVASAGERVACRGLAEILISRVREET